MRVLRVMAAPMRACRALVLLLAVLLAARSLALEGAEDRLHTWLEQNGGVAGFRTGLPCPTCVRGAIATKDFKGVGRMMCGCLRARRRACLALCRLLCWHMCCAALLLGACRLSLGPPRAGPQRGS